MLRVSSKISEMAPKKEEPPAKAARFGRVRNNLKMGILGLPNVGKSSLFNLLTEQVSMNETSGVVADQ